MSYLILSRYIASFQAGARFSAAHLVSLCDEAKLNRKFMLTLRQLVSERKLKLVGVAQYEAI